MQALGQKAAPVARGVEDHGVVTLEERYQAALLTWSHLQEEHVAFCDSTTAQLAALEV